MNSDIDYGRHKMSYGEYAALTGAALIADMAVFYLFYHSMFVCIIMFVPTEVFLLGSYKKYRIEKRRWRLTCEFEEMLGCIANALRTGYSLENSFYEAKKELTLLYGENRDILYELKNICGRIKLNYTVERILEDFAHRSGTDDIGNFAQIIAIAKRSGGNIISIVKQTADNIHDKREINEEIRTLMAGKRFEYKIMGLMPVGMIVYLGICSPGYMDMLYGNIIGQAVMTLCLVIYALSYYIAKRIMSFDSVCENAPDAQVKELTKTIFNKGFGKQRKRKNKAADEICSLYGIIEKSRFSDYAKKISDKAARVYVDMPRNKARARFWNDWFLAVKTGIAAAVFIVLIGAFYAKDSFIYVIILALVIAFLLPYGRIKGLDKKLKMRDEQLIMDYPEVINRMCLLTCAGSSMKGAWERIVNDYEVKRRNENIKMHYVYEEMKQALFELKNGVPEVSVYERFGQRIRLIPYMKLSTMLTHNLKKGNRYIVEQLGMSSLDAYVQRRENVKKMGEEASAKLLLPIMLQFILVLIIIMYPAIMSL